MGLRLLPPDVNESDEDFTSSNDAVRFGLTAIKGIGLTTIRAIVEARNAGRFTSLFDFASRLNQGAINRKALESLITSGAFDSLMPEGGTVGQWRANLFAAVETALAVSQKAFNDRTRGQTALFGGEESASLEEDLPNVRPWTQAEISAQEKTAIGFYLSVHPLDNYRDIVDGLRIRHIADHDELRPGDMVTIAGIVSAFQVRQSKKGNRFCMFRLEDQSTGVKCLAWSEAYGKHSQILKNDELLIVDGRVESAEGQDITIIVQDARSLIEAKSRNARSVNIALPAGRIEDDYLHEILSILNSETGKCEVYLDLKLDDVNIRLHSEPVRIQGSSRLEAALRSRGCDVEWTM